ncbi:MAG TPA: proline racemase family protein, partial [Trueperaceae bacterium]|nr:proline racemase family protein [Trueperaceae bacterium]
MSNPAGNPAKRVKVVDSHTGGEPTRVVIAGGPDLGDGDLARRLAVFRRDHDEFRSGVVNEPRGSDVMVGALLCEPVDPAATAGVIFFNNVGYLGMCGHGLIGLIATLSHLGRVSPGRHLIETPVGSVGADLHEDGSVSVHNVRSYRHAAGVGVTFADAAGLSRTVSGDVAWGGNWFFLCGDHGMEVSVANLEGLTGFAWSLREALATAGITGAGGAEIDHIELFAPSRVADSRSFVLCPGKAYDRSPCGTGTSAKLACLAADSKLAPGELWRQESV